MIVEKLLRNFYLLVFLLGTVSLRAYIGNAWGVNDVKIRCLDEEREALLKFKDGLVDESGLLASWGTDDNDQKDCCKWMGVRCHNQTNHVVQLDLHGGFDSGSYFYLEGKINPSLLDLQYLSYLDLSYNIFFNSNIPEFIGSFNNLQHLDLSYCAFTGPVPHHLGNLSKLIFLSLQGLPSSAMLNNYSLLISTNLHWISRFHSLIHLDLSNINLKSATDWLQAITKLPRLQKLNLKSTKLPSVVPPSLVMNYSKHLSVVDLSDNDLPSSSIFPWLFNFSNTLTEIHLDENNLQGSIPDAIGNINFLKTLSLSENKLEGGFPISFWNLSNLIHLDLSNNNLSGTLTQRIGTLSKLEVLVLAENQFEGVITEPHFLNLSRLQYLDLQSIPYISFNFSSKWIPPFQLRSLLLGGFKVGPYFPVWIRAQKKLVKLVISNASIDDIFPYWFWNLSSKLWYLDVSHNNIHGVIPNLSTMFTDFLLIDMSFNNFNCSLPILPPNGEALILSNNKFWGSFTILCKKTVWVHLDLSNNLLSGDLPDCLADLETLEYLSLSHNNFSGKIPSIRRISSLHLQNNSLTGEIPASLRNCISLKFIDISENKLSGKIPTWVGDSFPVLLFLSLRSNQFFGNIPSSLCQLPSIQVLDLSLNKISGPIPCCLGNFTAMINSDAEYTEVLFHLIYVPSGFESANLMWEGKIFEYGSILKLMKLIDLSSNNLDGEIPDAITSLVRLAGLNLSRNNLNGSIPQKTAQLTFLSFLDLSRNQLSGEIPASISHLDGLGLLDLSHNNLSGKIPWINHLQTFNTSTFEENSGLCGPPLTKVCPDDEISQDPKFVAVETREDEDKFITNGYYISMGLGFVFGFLGVIGILVLNQVSSFAFFMFVSNILDHMFVNIALCRNRLRGV